LKKSVLISTILLLSALNGNALIHCQTVREALTKTTTIIYSENGRRVNQTVAEALKNDLAPQARVLAGRSTKSQDGVISIAIADEEFVSGRANPPKDQDWMYLRLGANGNGEMIASKPHLLYTLFCRIRDEWLNKGVAQFENGKLLKTSFRWITGRDDLLTGRMGFLKNRSHRIHIADVELAIQELARLGCSHVVVNELATPYGYETGPDGEIYYRFYDYLPDLDQFVETKLNKGTYPREYLEANLNSLRYQAQLADKYGLTPGMHIANPRSVPESLLQRYPFLRGARVDHTFRSYKPRYTLTLAHPAVRWHYAELLRKLLQEVPELGFVITLINDSGSGFEYTASLYPGRNGGPYVVKEWLPDDVIAKAAAENVIRYYRMMRDVAHETHPHFRLITGLKNIAEESEIILAGIDNGIDLRLRTQRIDANKEHWKGRLRAFRDKGSDFFTNVSARGSRYVLGVPSPWQTHKGLQKAAQDGFERVSVEVDPPYLVSYSVNREVVLAFQINPQKDIDDVVTETALKWVGDERPSKLAEVWRLADQAVEAVPTYPLYGGLGFLWYRFWVRPFVPDIGAIPEVEREYYEKYMLSHFNNPHNVDFATDMLWTIETTAESDSFVQQFDTRVWEPLDKAIALSKQAVHDMPGNSRTRDVFVETRDRLIAYRCYCMTLRNLSAWISGVHGYLKAEDEGEKQKRLAMVREMVSSEMQNTKTLLTLWETSTVDFMPINDFGETMHDYGLNFGELLKIKISLMEKYGDRLPYIDPNFMWRMPEGADLDEDEYMNY
jgi:hypothetical protein